MTCMYSALIIPLFREVSLLSSDLNLLYIMHIKIDKIIIEGLLFYYVVLIYHKWFGSAWIQ